MESTVWRNQSQSRHIATNAITKPSKLRIAFVVREFPVISETFIVNQIADLIDCGVDVTIFTLRKGRGSHISTRYAQYRLAERTQSLELTESRLRRAIGAIPRALRLLMHSPWALCRALDVRHYRASAWSLKLLYNAAAFAGKKYDLIHCHFGDIAVDFLEVRSVLRIQSPLVTTFYGYDISYLLRERPVNYYEGLKRECDLFYVMSENMCMRALAHGFPKEKVKVLPVSIDVDSYSFKERTFPLDAPIKLLAVGRLVEKKGFDDLLRALAIVKQRSSRWVRCIIVGEGPLGDDLRRQCRDLDITNIVEFKGAMEIGQIVALMADCHVLVSPSKTARNGDME